MNNLHHELILIVRHNKDGSKSTQADRKAVLWRVCDILWEKFKGLKLKNLQKRHVMYVVDQIRHHASVKKELSHIRWLLGKLSKAYLLPKKNADLGIEKRTIVAKENKSWTGKIDIEEKIEEVSASDKTVGLVLKLCYYFGFRPKEAALFRPHENIKDFFIEVRYGTKGGRKREVPVMSEKQQAVIDELLRHVRRGYSLVPQGGSYKKFKNHFYYIVRKHGLTMANGLTPKGLRHTYACSLYEDMTGEKPPVLRGADEARTKNRINDRRARQTIAQHLGHGRRSISSAYIGGVR